jgi:lipoprotein-anchoring transpeptidase ErfK/SrfK
MARRTACSAAAGVLVAAAVAGAPPAVTAAGPRTLPRGVSYVAYAHGRRVFVYAHPGARRPRTSLPNPYRGGRLAFLARALRPHWVRVYLPTRPNGSSGWVRRRQVDVLLDYYRLRIDLRRRRLTVWRRGRVVMRQPVGVGRAATPTPTGRYYVVELIQLSNPRGSYGPYAFGISAHSDVYTRFGGGDGEIGIHGTDYPAGVGTRVSHGCIRLHNAAVVRLAKLVPLGTPVDILGEARGRPHRPARPPRARPHTTAPPPAPRPAAKRTPLVTPRRVPPAATRELTAVAASTIRRLARL